MAAAIEEFLLALAAQGEADSDADELVGYHDAAASDEAERVALLAGRRMHAAESRLKVAREQWVRGTRGAAPEGEQ